MNIHNHFLSLNSVFFIYLDLFYLPNGYLKCFVNFYFSIVHMCMSVSHVCLGVTGGWELPSVGAGPSGRAASAPVFQPQIRLLQTVVCESR